MVALCLTSFPFCKVRQVGRGRVRAHRPPAREVGNEKTATYFLAALAFAVFRGAAGFSLSPSSRPNKVSTYAMKRFR